ncbi:MAG TPA: 4-hydroxythreonine-4-phosphate dehydrogenase PdxA [Saprospiraceae bacterium]|nr:4-hydroxythreonine-4-phosphate dehydrogenase PdxA [Saprospiraceae bacterium]
MEKIRIGISTGDINGIGLEVTLKALNNASILEYITPVIYGNVKIASYHKNIVQLESMNFNLMSQGEKPRSGKINLVNCWNDTITINLGKATPEGGKYAMIALEKAFEDAQKGEIDAIVTGPVNKASLKLAGVPYVGHTDFLRAKSGKDALMMMVHDKLKLGLVTDHIPLADVSHKLTKELILSKLQILEETLRVDFGFAKPHIAVLGFNPHAGEEGMLGNEEESIIRPAVIEAKKNGMFVSGPFPADGFFGSGQFSKFDGILAMYHDQGLIPFKTICFNNGVNYSAGLPVVRTSPDHGTAYEIAGKNEANFGSMVEAIFVAKNIVQERRAYKEDRQNVLKKRPKLSEEMSE